MCELTGVSRSGFYNWIRSAASRYNKEIQDKSDFSLILEAYNYRGYAKGARGIYMRLRHRVSFGKLNAACSRRLKITF